MTIRILLILFLFSGFARGQYFDFYSSSSPVEIFRLHKPYKNIFENDVNILKKNKVKEVKVIYEDKGFCIYKLSRSGYLCILENHKNRERNFVPKEFYYYGENNQCDSIIYFNFDSDINKFIRTKAEYFYENRLVRFTLYAHNDTLHWINDYSYNGDNSNSVFLKNKVKGRNVFYERYEIQISDSGLIVNDYSTKQYPQTDTIYKSDDTIIVKCAIGIFKDYLNRGRFTKKNLSVFFLPDFVLDSPKFGYDIYKKFFYKSNGLIDYEIIDDGHDINLKVKYSYSYYED